MPDLWMDVDAALSEVPINLVALIDDTDFKTREESVVYNQSGLDLLWNFVTPAGAMTQTAVTPTDTAGAYDWVNQGNGYYTIEIPASGGGTINNDTEGFGWFSGFATGILPWRGPVIGFRAAGLNNVLVESAYSATRGLAGTALPAAVADAAGGLIVSDAGGLDADAMSADAADMQPLIEKMAYVGPRGLGVWIDDGAANTNTVLGTDGTEDNPVSTIAAATAIATALGSQRFYLKNDTQITLAQTYEGYEFLGIGIMNKVTLGSQDVDNTSFEGLILTGTQGGTQFMHPVRCQLEALLSVEILARDCELTGNIAMRVATNQTFINCTSATPGGGTPDLTFPGAGGATTVNWRHGSGGLTVKSARLNDVMSYDCPAGQLVIDASCTSLEIHVRGNCKYTDNGTTTIADLDAAVNRTGIADAAWDEARSGHTTPGTYGEQMGAVISATVDTVVNTHTPTTTEFQADDVTEATADHFKGRIVIFRTGVLAGQATDITGYAAVGGIGQFTVTALTEAPSNNDTFIIV